MRIKNKLESKGKGGLIYEKNSWNYFTPHHGFGPYCL
jgi:hypothetical protein